MPLRQARGAPTLTPNPVAGSSDPRAGGDVGGRGGEQGLESCPLGQPRPHVPGCGGKRRRPPGIPGVRGKRLQQVPNLGSPGPLAWHSVLRPRLRVRVCWVKRVGCGSGGGDPPGEASHVGSHMRTHSWGSPAHLQFLGFASAPSLAVDTLVTLPDEEHPSVPGVDAVCSLGAGTLGRRSHRVSSHPHPPQFLQWAPAGTLQKVTVQDWPSALRSCPCRLSCPQSQHSPWG